MHSEMLSRQSRSTHDPSPALGVDYRAHTTRGWQLMSTPPDAAPEGQGAISALLTEDRRYSPDAAFVAQANVSDPAIYETALKDPEAFWAEQAKGLDWIEPYTKVL